VAGAGVTGATAGRLLAQRGWHVAWFDPDRSASARAVRRWGGVAVDDPAELQAADVVVLAGPRPHAPHAADLVVAGRPVVSVADDPDDVHELLALDDIALHHGTPLVVGAGLAPGLTGLIAAHLAAQLDVAEEIHVAVHGTGGPACARQHHRALGSTSTGWHDGEWIVRPGGSGRELCWFPEPIGALDCYRAAVADPLVLHRAFPSAQRISARVSATRRDRLTARLPMLAPPRRTGDVGAVRIEVRGALASGERMTHVAGAGGRAGEMAGAVAAVAALRCVPWHTGRRWSAGAHVTGQDAQLGDELLADLASLGVALQEFTGVARATAW